MEYSTHIFEKNKNKKHADYLDTAGIIGFTILCLVLLLIGIPGIGIITIVGIVVTLFKLKIDSDGEKGITRYGALKATIVISTEHLIIRGITIPFNQLKELIIYVDEYEGMPKEYFGTYHGGNNEISFIHKEKKMSIYYFIKNKTDFRHVEKLVDIIENKTTAF